MFDRISLKIWARCCVLLLVLQALMPLSTAQAGRSDRLLLCSEGGTQLVQRLPDGSFGPVDFNAGRDRDAHGYSCPHCALAGVVSLAAPGEAKTEASTWSVDAEWKGPSSHMRWDLSMHRAHGARAPPLG